MHATSLAAVLALALTCAVQPALAQDARSCANEVRRLSEGLPILHAEDREGEPLAEEPGARKGASLQGEQRERIEGLVGRAGAAAEQGDGQGCMDSLAEARALLREAGLGSGQPGSSTYGGGDVSGGPAPIGRTGIGAIGGATGTGASGLSREGTGDGGPAGAGGTTESGAGGAGGGVSGGAAGGAGSGGASGGSGGSGGGSP
jgi:hypothetical protein